MKLHSRLSLAERILLEMNAINFGEKYCGSFLLKPILVCSICLVGLFAINDIHFPVRKKMLVSRPTDRFTYSLIHALTHTNLKTRPFSDRPTDLPDGLIDRLID